VRQDGQRDPVRKAQVNEALARTLLTEGNNAEGERLAREAVQMLKAPPNDPC
jgi:hypothetical protein